MTRNDAPVRAAELIAVVEEMVAEGCGMSHVMLVIGVGGDTSAGRRVFLRWLERHDRLDLRAHFERERGLIR